MIFRLSLKNVVLVNSISENMEKHDSKYMTTLNGKEIEQYDNPIAASDLSSPEGSNDDEDHRRRTRFNEDGDDRDILAAMEEDIEGHQYFAADQLVSSFSYFYQADGRFESHPRPKGRNVGNKRDGNPKSRQRSKRSKITKKKDSSKNGEENNKTKKQNDKTDGLDVAAKEVHLVQRRYGAKLL